MATSTFTPISIPCGDSKSHAFNDNGSQTSDIQPSSRILVALQDAEARRRMSRLLRAQGFRVIALDEPFAVWSLVADHASPRLTGFDFVICGGFRNYCGREAAWRLDVATRFFLLLGPSGFVPFAADGAPPPASAFRRACMKPVHDNSKRPGTMHFIGRSPDVFSTGTAPGHTQ
jgi:hypothetical protein